MGDRPQQSLPEVSPRAGFTAAAKRLEVMTLSVFSSFAGVAFVFYSSSYQVFGAVQHSACFVYYLPIAN